MGLVYQPLNEATHEIRLLTILNKDIVPRDGRLICRLDNVPGCDDPVECFKEREERDRQGGTKHAFPWGYFVATSYEWGSPAKDDYIMVNGCKFPLTYSAWCVLMRVHGWMVNRSSDFPLWIDAICVNQHDPAEVDRQIPRMRYIFGLAKQVWCFLSPAVPTYADEYPPEKNRQRSLEEIHRDMLEAPLMIAYMAEHSQDQDFFESRQDPTQVFDEWQWRALYYFYDSPFWKRLWIIQEIALARGVYVISKQIWINLEDVTWVATALAWNAGLTSGPLRDSVEKMGEYGQMSVWSHQSQIAAIRSRFRADRNIFSQDPAALIDQARIAEAAKPNDKVYGMLSLLSASQAALIRVDSKRPTSEVYTEFAASCVKHSGNLAILYYCSPAQNSMPLPSWVPDLTTWQRITRFDESTRVKFDITASLDPISCRPRVEGRFLIATGVFLDSVDGLGSTNPHYERLLYPETERGIVQPNGWQNSDPTRSDVTEIPVESFFHDFCLHLFPSLRSKWFFPSLQRIQRECGTTPMAAHLLKFYEQNKDLRLHSGRSVEQLWKLKPEEENPSRTDLCRFFQLIATFAHGLRMMCTSDGRPGLAYPDARKGDHICALAGLSAPCLLRRGKNGWKFVGMCYVHGLLDGIEVEKRKNETQEFQIE